MFCFFFFKQKTAYEMRISDWSSDVCSSDLTLRRIAEGGADVFYTGALAHEIDADMKAHGGLLSLQDLQNYRTQHNEPLWGAYRGHRIAPNHPPGGGVMVIEMLNLLENFDLRHRSEEHPAAHPYLITTSYALSFWKKKH